MGVCVCASVSFFIAKKEEKEGKDMSKTEQCYPNQRKISIHKGSCDNGELYTKIGIQSMNHAMKDLNGNAYKMWCYLAQNQNKYSFWLSPVDVCNVTKMSESTYHRAFKELVDKLYLSRNTKKRNRYDFYENPHMH